MDTTLKTADASLSGAAGYIPFRFPGVPHVRCAFTTRLAGNMSLIQEPVQTCALANRQRMLNRLGIKQWAEVRQVHGDGFIVSPQATDPTRLPDREADGCCTREQGLALAIKTADCQAVLLADKNGRAVAALHAGWRGNAMNFPGTAVARFCEAYGLDPGGMLAVRGPSLGPAAAEFVNFESEWPRQFRPWFDEQRRTMDLWSLLKHQLKEAGLRDGNIFSLDLCTWSLPDLFFSHRRRHTGRQISLIWISGENADCR